MIETTEKKLNEKTEVSLAEAVAGFGGAIVHAKHSMDKMSLALGHKYEKMGLEGVAPPFFSISNITIDLKFVVSKIERETVKILLDAASIEHVAPHLLSSFEFQLSPQITNIFKTENGETVYTTVEKEK